MDSAAFEALVGEAALAPSAHNTQPARWSHLPDGAILVSADLSRRLPVGDPGDRDLLVSCGAAVEGTVLALAARGHGAQVTVLSDKAASGMLPIATIHPRGAADPDDIVLARLAERRVTHRTGFSPPIPVVLDAPGVTLVTNRAEIGWLAHQIDRASARIMAPAPFRAELLHWMRLSPDHPDYERDGLNRAALGMDSMTARLVPTVLGTGVYRALSAVGLGPTLSGEARRSQDASAVALFHWPAEGCRVSVGRAFYRAWLAATAQGLAGWPAAALADDPKTATEIQRRFGLPTGNILINALRLGPPKGETAPNTRLPVSELIIGQGV